MAETEKLKPESTRPGGAVLDEPPPILESWPRVYLGVLLYLVCLLTALVLITSRFTY